MGRPSQTTHTQLTATYINRPGSHCRTHTLHITKDYKPTQPQYGSTLLNQWSGTKRHISCISQTRAFSAGYIETKPKGTVAMTARHICTQVDPHARSTQVLLVHRHPDPKCNSIVTQMNHARIEHVLSTRHRIPSSPSATQCCPSYKAAWLHNHAHTRTHPDYVLTI